MTSPVCPHRSGRIISLKPALAPTRNGVAEKRNLGEWFSDLPGRPHDAHPFPRPSSEAGLLGRCGFITAVIFVGRHHSVSASRGGQLLLQFLAMPLDHLDQERRDGRSSAFGPGPLESNSVQQHPKLFGQMESSGFVRALLGFGSRYPLCHQHQCTSCQLLIDESLVARSRLSRVVRCRRDRTTSLATGLNVMV